MSQPQLVKSNQETLNYWQQHVERWQASQEKMSAYCRQHELKLHQFKYWRYRLLSTSKGAVKKEPNTHSKLFSPIKLESIQPTQVEMSKSISCFELTINAKLSLKVPGNFHSQSLKRLLQLLEVL